MEATQRLDDLGYGHKALGCEGGPRRTLSPVAGDESEVYSDVD